MPETIRITKPFHYSQCLLQFCSLRHHRQESETINSRASETNSQLQQEKEQLSHQLQDARVERDKLLEQLREAYSEKEKNEGQLQMLNQNLSVLQNQEEERKKEKLEHLVCDYPIENQSIASSCFQIFYFNAL